jgi:peptidoglycan/LPS O-acetylase OafA/YrhL
MGDWSFSIYLMHVPILYFFSKVISLSGGLSIFVSIFFVIFGSALFSIYIEHPSCAYVKKYFSSKVKYIYKN